MKLDRDKLEKELWEDLASALDPDIKLSKKKETDPQPPEQGDLKWNKSARSKK